MYILYVVLNMSCEKNATFQKSTCILGGNTEIENISVLKEGMYKSKICIVPKSIADDFNKKISLN